MNLTNNHISGILDELRLDRDHAFLHELPDGRDCFALTMSANKDDLLRLSQAIANVIDDERLVVEMLRGWRRVGSAYYWPTVTAVDWMAVAA